jgi:hypothetical protein
MLRAQGLDDSAGAELILICAASEVERGTGSKGKERYAQWRRDDADLAETTSPEDQRGRYFVGVSASITRTVLGSPDCVT